MRCSDTTELDLVLDRDRLDGELDEEDEGDDAEEEADEVVDVERLREWLRTRRCVVLEALSPSDSRSTVFLTLLGDRDEI